MPQVVHKKRNHNQAIKNNKLVEYIYFINLTIYNIGPIADEQNIYLFQTHHNA